MRKREKEKIGGQSQESAWISCNVAQHGLVNQEAPNAMPLVIHFAICPYYYPIIESGVAKWTDKNGASLMRWPSI